MKSISSGTKLLTLCLGTAFAAPATAQEQVFTDETRNYINNFYENGNAVEGGSVGSDMGKCMRVADEIERNNSEGELDNVESQAIGRLCGDETGYRQKILDIMQSPAKEFEI